MAFLERLRGFFQGEPASEQVAIPWPEGLEMPDGTILEYSNLQRAVATKEARFVGDVQMVVLDFGDGWIVPVNEEQPAWRPLLEALDRHPRKTMDANEWQLRLMASGDEQVEIELLS